MLIKLNYADVQSDAVRGEVEGKKVTFFMRVRVDENNIEEAIKKLDGNKFVVAFDYEGSLDFLRTIEVGKTPVLVTKNIDFLGMDVDFILNEVGTKAHLVCNLPEDYKDMRSIFNFCQKYTNIRFIGGNFLHLNGCRIGSVLPHEIPRRIPESRMPLVTTGDGSIMRSVTLADVDNVEFFVGKVTAKEVGQKSPKKAKAKSKGKKQLASLLSLTSTSGFENF